MRKELGQRGDRLLVATIDKKALSGQAPEHIVMAQGIDHFFPVGIVQSETLSIVTLVDQTVYSPMLTIAVRVDVGVPGTGLGCVTSTVRVRRWVVLDDEVVPVGKPEVSIRSNFGNDRREPLVGAGNQTEGIDGLEARAPGPYVVHPEQVTGRPANESPAVSPGLGKSG